MSAYLIRRILLLFPTLFIVSVIVFAAIRMMPGDFIDMLLSDLEERVGGAPQIDRAAMERHLGLDVLMHIQYLRWVGVLPGPDINTGEIRYNGLLQGNLGTSLRSGVPATEEILRRLPISFELNLLSMLIAWMIALPVGIYSALRQNTWFDYIGRSFAILSLATPAFWLASMLIVFAGRYWSWAPRLEYVPFFENPVENLKMFLLPAFLTGTAVSGALMRSIRTMTLEVIRQDYIRTAYAKGLKERVVVIRHALKNVGVLLVEIAIPTFGAFLGGSVIMENIFVIPGVGRYLIDMLTTRDYFVTSGVNLIFATFGMLLVLLTDISYAWVDPRIRYR